MFKDVKPGTWYYSLIEKFINRKAVSGYEDGTFRPNNNATRAEVLSMIDRAEKSRRSVVAGLAPSVVKITAKQKDGRLALGSGVVLDKAGHIATNVHVVTEGPDVSQEIAVYTDKSPSLGLRANVLYGDFTQDIAIIKVPFPPDFLQPVGFAAGVNWMESLFVVGNPLGHLNTASMGIVSFEKRVFGASEWIQTDASINPGNSGGGAFNIYGQLLGLPTYKVVWADQAMTVPISNIGFITPCWKIKERYQQVLAAGNTQVKLVGEPVEFIMTA